MSHCEFSFDHEPGEMCVHCSLLVDDYGNTEEDFENCSFPDCGCDGQRLCMSPKGANAEGRLCNKESMYRNTDTKSLEARRELLKIVARRSSHEV